MIIDEVLTDRSEIVQDPRYAEFPAGRVIHIRAKPESGGPYELWIVRGDETLKVFKGIVSESTFEFAVPEDGELGFDFQSTGQPGNVRLQVY